MNFKRGKKKFGDFLGEYYEYYNQSKNKYLICKEHIINNRAILLQKIENLKNNILNKSEYFLNTLDYSVDE